MNTVMVLFSLQVGVAVVIEASLSFLGVGVPPPEPSWGLMMAQERGSDGRTLVAGRVSRHLHHDAGAVGQYAGRLIAGPTRSPAP
jgi:hypothetical protein